MKDSLLGLAAVNIDRDVSTMGCTSTAPKAQGHVGGCKGVEKVLDELPALVQLSSSFQLSRLCFPWQSHLQGITCIGLAQHHCKGPSAPR